MQFLLWKNLRFYDKTECIQSLTIFFYLFGLSYAMLADYLISYLDVTYGELCLATKLFFFNFSNKKQKHRAVILAHSFTEKGAALPLFFHLKACYLSLYLSINKASADFEQKNSLKALQKGINFVSWAG